MTRSATRATLAPLVATALALATIAALAFVSISGDRAEAGTTHTVFVNNSVFCESAGSSCAQPYSIQIDAGDTVQWSDGQSGVLHTVTQCSGDGAGCPDSGGFDSGFLTDPPGGYLTQAFPDEGTFFYRCQVHRHRHGGANGYSNAHNITHGDRNRSTNSLRPFRRQLRRRDRWRRRARPPPPHCQPARDSRTRE